METESKQKTRRGFKGSVLFTILVVMLVVLMLMVTTVGLASNASRRAYSEYFDHQTTSTARSVVDSVIYSLKSDNATLGASIVTQLQNNHSTPITVQVNGGNNLGEGFGTVDSLVFSYVGEDSAAGGFNITGSGKPIIRVTATVTQGGVTSSYSQYCIGETKSDNKTSSGGGLIALGGFEGAAQPGVDAHSPAYFGVKNPFTYDKLVTLSNPNNGSLNALVVNSSAEIKTSIPFSLDKKEGVSIMGNLFLNDGISNFHIKYNDSPSAATQAAINSQIATIINDYKSLNELSDADCDGLFDEATTDVYNYLLPKCDDGSGGTDWNKYNRAKTAREKVDVLRNSGAAVDSLYGYYNEVENAKTNGTSLSLTENPYLYVGGTLYLKNGLNVGYNSAPMNVYCGRIVTEHNGHIVGNANIYCYNSGSTTASYNQANAENFAKNPWSKIGTDNLSMLLSWAEQTVNPDANKNTSIDSGSFYTMGNLELTKKVSIARDLYVDGDVNVHDLNTGDSSIGGNVYIKGSVSGSNALTALKSIVKGTIYTGTSNVDGVSLAYNSSVLPANVNNFLSGNLKLDSIKNSVVKTTDALKKQFYKDVKDSNGVKIGETFTDSVNKSLLIVSGSTVVYTCPEASKVEGKDLDDNSVTIKSGSVSDFNYALEINESCILKGTFKNTNIYVNPTSEIWIDCHNFCLDNSQMIINDRNGRVNFFMPYDSANLTDVNVTTGYEDKYKALFSPYTYTNGSVTETYVNSLRTDSTVKIQTLDYYEKMKAGSRIDLITYPTNDLDEHNVAKTDNDWMLPKVGFYANENANVLINFTNNVFLTGDICAPSASFYAKSGCADASGAQIYYNGNKVSSGKVGCIGSIIVDKIKQFDNDFGMVYVDYPSSYNPGIGGGLQYEWTPIDGFADY